MTAGPLVAGFGFRDMASLNSLQDVFELALAKGGYEARAISGFAVPADKVQHQAFLAFAAASNKPIYAIDAGDIKATLTPTQSAVSLEKRAVGSVAEAAALAFFSEAAKVRVTRQISTDKCATCAIIEGVSGTENVEGETK